MEICQSQAPRRGMAAERTAWDVEWGLGSSGRDCHLRGKMLVLGKDRQIANPEFKWIGTRTSYNYTYVNKCREVGWIG
jgi:hypothetical protein